MLLILRNAEKSAGITSHSNHNNQTVDIERAVFDHSSHAGRRNVSSHGASLSNHGISKKAMDLLETSEEDAIELENNSQV